jgi:DUF971 family protein
MSELTPPVLEPVEVRHHKSRRVLAIEWSDGHRSEFALDYLRSWCPCAGCQGHAPIPRYLDLKGQSLAGIEPVGNYALMLRWADGHDTGLWAWPRLRELCPCPACGGEKRE